MNPGVIVNPILPGFHPDPSVVRVEDDFYIATSTFEYYPAIRIHHSRDLRHWRPIGHLFTDARHLDLRGVPNSGGVWAPSLSAHQGRFYAVYSVVLTRTGPFKDVYNYLVTAPSITGPWSEPIPLNRSGFDPALFHDDDGRQWLVNVQWDPRPDRPSFAGIVLQQFDARQGRLVGPVQTILQSDRLIEGPNLYKVDGRYYLMVAQGGTGWEHGIAMARADRVTGPYEPDPQENLLTARDRPDLPLQKAGHGELVQTRQGQWFLVHLASRPVGARRRCILGRETCLQSCRWTADGWLRLTSGGRAPAVTVAAPDLPARPVVPEPERDDFDGPVLGLQWASPRRPLDESWLSLTARPGWLRLTGQESLHSRFRQSLLLQRLQDFRVTAETLLDARPTHFNHAAGLVCWYDTDNHFVLSVTFDSERGRHLALTATDDGRYHPWPAWRVPVATNRPIRLRARIDHETLRFAACLDGRRFQDIGPVLDMTVLSDDAGDTLKFTGAMVGLCAQDLQGSGFHADFDYFEMRS